MPRQINIYNTYSHCQFNNSATPNLPTNAIRSKCAKEYTKATFEKTFKVRLLKQYSAADQASKKTIEASLNILADKHDIEGTSTKKVSDIIYHEHKQLKQGTSISAIQASRTREAWKMLYDHSQTNIVTTLVNACENLLERSNHPLRSTPEESKVGRMYQIYDDMRQQIVDDFDTRSEQQFAHIPILSLDNVYATDRELLIRSEREYIRDASSKRILESWGELPKDNHLDELIQNITRHVLKPLTSSEKRDLESGISRTSHTSQSKPYQPVRAQALQPHTPSALNENDGASRHMRQNPDTLSRLDTPSSRRPQ